jgi:hypothetical protein
MAVYVSATSVDPLSKPFLKLIVSGTVSDDGVSFSSFCRSFVETVLFRTTAAVSSSSLCSSLVETVSKIVSVSGTVSGDGVSSPTSVVLLSNLSLKLCRSLGRPRMTAYVSATSVDLLSKLFLRLIQSLHFYDAERWLVLSCTHIG